MYGVYIVDDEILMIKSIINTVSWPENGFEVVGYNTNPQAAIDEIPRLAPHVVFCDLKMPGMDGIEFIRNVKQIGADTEFIMLTAFREFDASVSFFRMDGFDYLLKPLQALEADIVLERLSRKLAKKNNLTPSADFAVTKTKAFDELITYVSENFDKKHTLKTLSQQFNINPNYICNLFSKHYQCTLTIFLTNIRMREAARLITETELALKEIAILCGYTDYFHFCKVFKAFYGIPPTQFRQENKSLERI